MALIDPTSGVADAALHQMYTEHVEGIREIAAALAAPPYPITDPSRIALARGFAENVLGALSALEQTPERSTLVRRVNLSYEAMLILIDYLKTYTSGPRVPRHRTTSG